MNVGTQDNPSADTPMRAKRSRRVGRRRVILAVVCLVMGVLVGVAGVVSGWRGFGYQGKQVEIDCNAGALSTRIMLEGTFRASGWGASPWESSFSWNGAMAFIRAEGLYRYDWGVLFVSHRMPWDPNAAGIVISLWLLAAVFLLTGTGLAFSARRSIRRARIGLCPTCNYDLRGLPDSAPCPECGKVRVDGVASGDEGKGGS